MPKFFTKPEYIHETTLQITGEDVAHISKVLRMQPGSRLTVCDGAGTDYTVSITSVAKDAVQAAILEKHACGAEPHVQITLFQALPKQGKMEYIIQKNTELGISRLVPVYTRRCVVKPSDKTERWAKIAEAAAKQSGRGIIPAIAPVMPFEAALLEMRKADLALMPYEGETEARLKPLLKQHRPATISIFIGPEGGFDPSEIQAARRAGIATVTLGKRILRTETAAAAVIPIMMYEYEEL